MRALKRIPENSILVLRILTGSLRNEKNTTVSRTDLLSAVCSIPSDGFGYCHQLIIFMTTNYKCNLDSALIRPGRVDYNLHFGYATKNQIKKMFHNFFPKKTTRNTLRRFGTRWNGRTLQPHGPTVFLGVYGPTEKLSDNVEEIETVDYAGTQWWTLQLMKNWAAMNELFLDEFFYFAYFYFF